MNLKRYTGLIGCGLYNLIMLLVIIILSISNPPILLWILGTPILITMLITAILTLIDFIQNGKQ